MSELFSISKPTTSSDRVIRTAASSLGDTYKIQRAYLYTAPTIRQPSTDWDILRVCVDGHSLNDCTHQICNIYYICRYNYVNLHEYLSYLI